jgi:zinc protease
MNNRLFRLIIAGFVLLAVTISPLVGQDLSKLKYPKLNPLVVPKVERITLDNGIRLYLLQDKSLPIFNMQVLINGGSYLEPPGKIGLTDICGDVLRTGGTAKWTGDQIDEMLESVGGSVETSIGLLTGSASVDVLSEQTDLGLEILAEILRRPVFNQDKIDLALVTARSMISRRNDDPSGIGRREFLKAIYGPQSVYARQAEYATVNTITREDLIAFHKAVFNPENIQMAIWGDFDRDAILAKVKQYFGDWAKGGIPLPDPPKVDYKFENKVYLVEKKDVNQSNVYIGHIGGLVTDPDYAARIVMNNILGGSFGSRLFNNVRSKEGLAYSAFGVYSANFKYPGVFYNFASTKSETTEKAAQEIITQIKTMQTLPPNPEEMSVGKDGYLNSFVFKFESKASVVNRLMTYDYYGLPEDFLFKEKDAVEKVTPDNVVAAAKKNLRPEALKVVVVGKSEDFGTTLDKLNMGPVENLDITIPAAVEKKPLAITPDNLKKGKEILDKAVAAHGGVASFKKVKSVSTKGTYTLATPQGDFPLSVEEVNVLPDKARQVITVMGQKLVMIRNGATGWKSNPKGEIVEQTADEIKEADVDWARNPIQVFRSSDKPEYQAVYDGSGDVNSAPVDFVAVVDKDGKALCRFAFDSKTGLMVSKSYEGKSMKGEGTIDEVFSDFKTVSGLNLPMSSAMTLNGDKLGSVKYDEYVINGTVAADAFNKPQ